MTRLKRRTTVGALWISAEAWGQQLLQFLLFAILARLLGPQAYGLLALAMMVIVVGDVLITNGGWSEALIQRRDLDPRCTDTVFWFLVAAAGSLAALVILLAVPVAAALRQPELAPIIACLSAVLPLASLCVVPDALLRREFRNAPLAARSLLATAGGGLVAVPMAFAGFGVWSLVAFQLVQPLIRAVVLWSAHPWRPAFRFSGPHLHEITRYVGGVLGERVLGSLDFVIPRVVLGHALGPAAVGQFTTARKILDLLVYLLIRPVSRVAMPSFAGLAGDRARTQELFTFGAQFAGLVAFPGHVGLALVAPALIPLVFGPAWSPSVPAVQVLTLFGLILPLSQLCTALMQGIGRVGWQMALAGGSTALFACLLALSGATSILAVAAAFVARAYIVFPLRVYVVRRATGLRVGPALLGSARLLLATGLMAAAVLAWQRLAPPSLHPGLSIAGSAVVGVVAYGASVLLLARPLVRQGAGLIRSVAGPPLGEPDPSIEPP
jgi:PST family polysaccharide transporter